MLCTLSIRKQSKKRYLMYSRECLITKEFRENENASKLAIFIKEIENVTNNEKSPYTIVQNTVFVFIEENEIMFLALLSEDVK